MQTSITDGERQQKTRTNQSSCREINSLSSEVENTSAEHECLPGFQSSPPWDVAPPHIEQIPDLKMTMACNHLRQLHEATANPKRQRPPPGRLRKEDILDQYTTTFEGLGQLGPPVQFQVDDRVQPVQMPVH